MKKVKRSDNAATEDDLKYLSEYRDNLQSEITEKEKDYHTAITYITAGALGLFLTINEKFFKVAEAHYTWLLFMSLGALLLTMLLFLIASIIDIKADETLRDLADEMLTENKYDDNLLLTEWKWWTHKARLIYYFRFLFLMIGISMEVFFISLNLGKITDLKEHSNNTVTKVEAFRSSDAFHAIIETTNQKIFLLNQ